MFLLETFFFLGCVCVFFSSFLCRRICFLCFTRQARALACVQRNGYRVSVFRCINNRLKKKCFDAVLLQGGDDHALGAAMRLKNGRYSTGYYNAVHNDLQFCAVGPVHLLSVILLVMVAEYGPVQLGQRLRVEAGWMCRFSLNVDIDSS